MYMFAHSCFRKIFFYFKPSITVMKKFLPFLFLCIAGAKGMNAQSVAVSAAPITPNASAMLEVSSTTKGFLPPRMSTVERDAIASPATGLVIYNTTTGCLNFWKQTAWWEVCGTCAPQPTQSNAGPDQLSLAGTSATLAANTPNSGIGLWSIISGTGGNVATPNSPTSIFGGVPGQFYTLRWTISTGCGVSSNDVDISFAGAAPNIISLAQLRALYQGTDIKITNSTQITGVVISDTVTKSVSRGTVILQQGNAGMNVFFGSSATNTYNLGDSVLMDITGDSLINFKGSLEVKATVAQRTAPVATNKTVSPKTKTIAELNAALAAPLGSAANIEYTLVKIANATITGTTANYSGPNTISDSPNDDMIIFTRTQATFAGTPYPTAAASYTGYIFTFNGIKEFQIRNLTDVQ
jgi:hypothetical protein